LGIKLVVFDFDGTLSNSFPLVISLVEELTNKFKVKRLDHVSLETMRGLPAKKILKMHRVPFWKLPAMVRFTRKKMNANRHAISLFEGVDTMLVALNERKIQLAMITTNNQENVRHVLGEKLWNLFSYMEDRVSMFGKPASLKRVIRKSGVKEDEVLSIGDEIRDLDAAHKVMVPFGAVTWGYSTRVALEERRPKFIFTSMDQIVELIDSQV
jgi:phosphoglycolate phosphatase